MANRKKNDPKAEATKAPGKAVSKALDFANAVGRFLDRVFGNALEDAVGLAGDPLRAFCLRRLADMQRKTHEYLAQKGITATETISPLIGYTLIQEALLEDDERLHDKFARLLAEAHDPDGERITQKHGDVMAGQ